MHLALPGQVAADGGAVGGEAPQEPVPVPEDAPGGLDHGVHPGLVRLHVRGPAQRPGRIQEVTGGPDQQESHHGAFPAAQVQAVIPVRPQPPGNAVGADLTVGKIQRGLHMLPDGGLALIRVGDDFIKEGQVAAFPDVFHDGRQQPERVVGAGVLDAVKHALRIRLGNDGGGFETVVGLFLQQGGIEQMEAVALSHLASQQLAQAAGAHGGLRVGNAHGVLGGVPVSQAGAAAYLNKGGKTGKEDIDFRLVQIPDVQGPIQVFVGSAYPQGGQLFIPEGAESGKGRVRAGGVVPAACPLRRFPPARAQIEEDAGFLPGLEQELFPQRAAGVAPQLRGTGQIAGDDADGIPLRMIGADERFPDAVKAIRLKAAREKLIGVRLVMQLAEHRAAVVMGPRGIQAHLKILVVHVNFMEGELHISIDAEAPGPVGVVPHADVENLHRVLPIGFNGNEKRLPAGDPVIRAGKGGIAQSVAGFVPGLGQGQPGGLPAEGPVPAGIIIPQIHVMPGPVHGYAVGTKPGDPVMLGTV